MCPRQPAVRHSVEGDARMRPLQSARPLTYACQMQSQQGELKFVWHLLIIRCLFGVQEHDRYVFVDDTDEVLAAWLMLTYLLSTVRGDASTNVWPRYYVSMHVSHFQVHFQLEKTREHCSEPAQVRAHFWQRMRYHSSHLG